MTLNDAIETARVAALEQKQQVSSDAVIIAAATLLAAESAKQSAEAIRLAILASKG